MGRPPPGQECAFGRIGHDARVNPADVVVDVIRGAVAAVVDDVKSRFRRLPTALHRYAGERQWGDFTWSVVLSTIS
jgi:hypothetical protein